MITGYTCWHSAGRVTAMLMCKFDQDTGEPDSCGGAYPALFVLFDGVGPFRDAGLFGGTGIDAAVPAFGSRDAGAADAWLVSYAGRVNGELGGARVPWPESMKGGG